MNWNFSAGNFSLRLPVTDQDGDALYELMSVQAQVEVREQKLREAAQKHQAEVAELKQEVQAKVETMARLRSFMFAQG